VRVAHETYVHFARFGDDTENQKGEPPGSPFDFVRNGVIAALNLDDDGDGVCCAGDGADHAKKLD
jgi:hypothetical protein